MMSGKMSIDSSISVNQQPTTNIQALDCEVCEYCGSPRLIQHSEGFTCLECSRVTLGVYHTDTIESSHHNNIPYHKYPEEILSEIMCRVGIPECVKDRTIQLFLLAKNRFKTKSNVDLILISIYQSYCERRIFISFYRLKEYYYTQSTISILNNLHFNLTSKQIFKFTPSFSLTEISDSLFSYFRISKKYKLLILTRYSDILKVLKYDSIIIILGCTIQLLSNKNKIDGSIDIAEVLNFVCVKKSTVMVKMRIYQKLLLNLHKP